MSNSGPIIKVPAIVQLGPKDDFFIKDLISKDNYFIRPGVEGDYELRTIGKSVVDVLIPNEKEYSKYPYIVRDCINYEGEDIADCAFMSRFELLNSLSDKEHPRLGGFSGADGKKWLLSAIVDGPPRSHILVYEMYEPYGAFVYKVYGSTLRGIM